MYRFFKIIFESLFHSLKNVYPFEFVDFENEFKKINSKQNIVQMICDFDKLQKEDIEYLRNLSNAELIDIILLYDSHFKTIKTHILHD
jgi:hypothetical protein